MLAPEIQTIQGIRKALQAAIRRKDLLAIKQLRVRLELARSNASYRHELNRMVAPVVAAIIGALTLDPTELGRLVDQEFEQLYVRLREWFARRASESAQTSKREAADDLVEKMSAAQLRADTGLNWDQEREPLPEPGPVESLVPNTGSITPLELFLIMSPMLAVAGIRVLRGSEPRSRFVFPEPFFRETTIDTERQDVASHWRRRLEVIRERLREIRAMVIRQVALAQTIAELRTIGQRLRALMGLLPSDPGIVGRTLTELRHENLKTRGEGEIAVVDALGSVVGYRLNSRFLATTAPDHAARDGWTFYKDDRPESNLPWANRLIPPYRKNCVCFTTPLIEDPEGNPMEPAFGIRYSRKKPITIRDVGTFRDWFNQQGPTVQQTIMGERRWFAAASRGVGKLRYEDFLRPDGRIMPTRKLLSESLQERELRSRQAARIMEIQSERFREAWRSGNGRFASSPELEAEYRKRLLVYLQNASR